MVHELHRIIIIMCNSYVNNLQTFSLLPGYFQEFEMGGGIETFSGGVNMREVQIYIKKH